MSSTEASRVKVVASGIEARDRPIWRGRDALRRRALAGADLLTVTAVATAAGLFDGADPAFWTLLTAPVWIVLAKLNGLYDRDHRSLRHVIADELASLFTWITMSVAATFVVLTLLSAGSEPITRAVELWLFAAVCAPTFRSVARSLWRRLTPPEWTLVVGGGALAEAAKRKIELFPEMHVELAGVRENLDAKELGEGSWLRQYDRIILASSSLDDALVTALTRVCKRFEIKLTVVPPGRGIFSTAVQLKHVAELPVVEYNTWNPSRSTLLMKRVIDVSVAAVGLVCLAPLLLAVALAVRVDSRGPVIFSQVRAGRLGRTFRMYKFRTMVENAEELLDQLVRLDELDEPMFKLENDPRVTRVGRFLRRTSLDELPQLFNVLRGDMSLVGPRPEQVEVVELYDSDHAFRLRVKPGLTGPMQVYGRGALRFEERLAVEREYIENISLGRDLRILVLTFAAVITGRGAI